VNENAQADFALLAFPGGCSQGGTQQSLVSAERAFNLPALPEKTSGETTPHQATVFALWPPACGPAPFGRNETVRPELLANEDVDFLGVEAGVQERPAEVCPSGRVAQDRGGLARVASRTARHLSGQKQMCGAVDRGGQFRPTAYFVPFAPAEGEIPRNMAGLEPRGVSGNLRVFCDQFERNGLFNAAVEKLCEAPFFSSRFSAFWMHV